jgi:hypothetical protein
MKASLAEADRDFHVTGLACTAVCRTIAKTAVLSEGPKRAGTPN